MKKYKIYCLKHPITLEIRYIGATSSTLKNRFYQHKYMALQKQGQTYVAKWFRKIVKETNLLPIIELLEECTCENWEEREKYWINFYPNLTNLREGGKGIIVNRTLDSVERSSRAKWKKIVQFDLEGNFIKIWNSIKEACTFYKKSQSAITNVLKQHGGTKTVDNFYWMYYEEYILKGFNVVEKINKPKKIYQYDLQGNFIKEWDYISQVSNYFNIYSSQISNALDKINKSGKPAICKNFIWKTKKNYEDIV